MRRLSLSSHIVHKFVNDVHFYLMRASVLLVFLETADSLLRLTVYEGSLVELLVVNSLRV